MPYNSPTILAAWRPDILADGSPRADLEAISIELFEGPRFGRAVLALSALAGQAPPRLGGADALPAVGTAIDIQAGGQTVFAGQVVAHELALGPEGESLRAIVAHRLAGQLGAHVRGRWQQASGGPVEIRCARLIFDNAASPRASAQTVALHGRTCRVFDGDFRAVAWTVADALTYLLAAHAPPDLAAPTADQIVALGGGLELPRIDLTGLPLGEALCKVAAAAGLSLRADAQQGLSVFRPGLDGELRTVALEPPAQPLDAETSNLWQGRITTVRRPARPTVIAVGAVKLFESTFELSPGWDAARQSARWRDTVRSLCDDWPLRADVFRKWVLNEHAWYCGSPWNLPARSLDAISSADFLAPAPRPLRPCLSRDAGGKSLGVVVEVRCSVQGPWRRWRGPLWIARDEAAVYLGGDALPADFFQAALADQAAVRVTAAVEADTRLTCERPGDPGGPVALLDLGDRAAFRQVHASSVFYDAPGLGAPDVRDDSAVLAQHAQTHARAAAGAVDASLTLAWPHPQARVGDRLAAIAGRSLDLQTRDDRLPCVLAVRHDLGGDQTTRLTVIG